MKLRRIHTREFKVDLCKRIDAKDNARASAVRQCGLAPSMLGRWLDAYPSRVADGAADWHPGEADKDERIAQHEQALGQA